MYRGKVTKVDTKGVYVQTAEFGVLGPCQAVVANYAVGDMVLCDNVGDEASPELVVVGQLSAAGSAASIPDGSITSAKIANATIKNEDVATDAAIAVSKLAGHPTSTTDNTIPRFHSTSGELQTSSVLIDDNNRLRVASGSTGGLEIGSSGVLALSGTGGPSGISAPVGSTWRQTDANASHGSLSGLLWNKVGTGTTEGTDWLVDYEGRWVTYTATWTNVSMSSTTARYTRRGKFVTFSCVGTLSSAPSGAVSVTTPTDMGSDMAHGPVRLVRSGSWQGVWFYTSASSVLVRYLDDANTWQNLSSTLPASWASGDKIALNGTYEIA